MQSTAIPLPIELVPPLAQLQLVLAAPSPSPKPFEHTLEPSNGVALRLVARVLVFHVKRLA